MTFVFNDNRTLLISNGKNVFALEREDLSNIELEKKISHTEDIKDLDSSDFIVRGKTTSLFPEGLKLELQLLPVRKKGKTSLIPLTINQKNVPDVATKTSGKILTLVSALPQTNEADLKKESKIFTQKGEMCIERMDYRNAIQFFEVAAILDPENIKAKARYAYAMIRYLDSKAKIEFNSRDKITWYHTKDKNKITNAEYMYMIAILRKSINFARDRKVFLKQKRKRTLSNIRLISNYEYCHKYLTKCHYTFLKASYQQFSDTEKQEIQMCRAELKDFFKSYFLSSMARKNETEKLRKELQLRYATVIFETPEECFATIKPLFSQVKVPWGYFRMYNFVDNHFWDKAKTRKLWLEMLKEFTASKLKKLQFNALLNLCVLEGSVYGSNQNLPAAQKHQKYFQQLLDWLQKDDNFIWVNNIPPEKPFSSNNTIRSILNEIHNLPILTQNQIFKELALKPFSLERKIWRPEIEDLIRSYCRYLKKRKELNVLSKQNIEDNKAINFLYRKAKLTINEYDPANADKYEKLFKKLLPISTENSSNRKIIKSANNNYPSGKRLIYTSGTRIYSQYYQGLELFYDQGVAWIIFSTSKGFQITRIDLNNGKNNTVDIPISKMTGNFPVKITRFKDYLCLAGKNDLIMVPIIDKAPYLDVAAKVSFGPKLGDTQIGEIKKWHERHVTSLAPGKDYLYISLLETVARRTRSGAIYRWKPGLKECKKVCASDSLGGTALDDSAPYKVVAATELADSADMIFVLYGDPRVLGFWRYSTKNQKFKHILKEYINEHTDRSLTPPFLFKDNFYIPSEEQCRYFNIRTLKLDQIFLSAFIQPGQEIFNPVPILGQEKGFWAVIKEKNGQVSINNIDKNAKIHPIMDDSLIYKYVATPKGLVVGASNGKNFNFYFVPNNHKRTVKNESEKE